MFMLFNDSVVDDIGKFANAGWSGGDVNVDDSERNEYDNHSGTVGFRVVHVKLCLWVELMSGFEPLYITMSSMYANHQRVALPWHVRFLSIRTPEVDW